MADPFGIIGVIGVAGQVVKAGVNLGLDWKDAPTEVRNFLEELNTLKTVLSETNTNIILNEDVRDAFEGRHSTILSQFGHGASPDSDTKHLISTCKEELENLVKQLDKQAGGRRLGWERIKSAFRAGRTHAAVEDLQRRCRMLNSMAAIDTIAIAANTLSEVKSTRSELQMHRNNEEKEKILQWITPITFAAQQVDNLERRQSGTGQWLLDSPEFQRWANSDRKTIFCPGMPGAGKTILTSMVIEHLQMQARNDPSVGIAYIFCNFRRKDEQGPRNLLASILRQLYESLPFDMNEIVRYYVRLGNGRTSLSTPEIVDCLRLVASRYTKVYILVDALDELQQGGGSRDKIVTTLLGLHEANNVNIFATSRHIPEIACHFQSNPKIEIRASEHDVRKYLDDQMSYLPSSVRKNVELQEDIRRSIVQNVQGMFLLAQLQLRSLTGKRSAKAVKEALAKFSSGFDAYDTAYDEAMERIEGQLDDQAALAKDALSWIVCAKRPLTTLELQYALAIEEGSAEFDEDNISELEDIVSVCAGLITVDEESGIIRLVHYTTQEYFDRTQNRWLPDAENLITVSCIGYLSLDKFSGRRFMSETGWLSLETVRIPFEMPPFYDYAARQWGFHARKAPSTIELVTRFLQNEDEHMHLSFRFLQQKENMETSAEHTGLHVAAYFGLKKAFEDIRTHLGSQFDINVKDTSQYTPLYYAVFKNDATFIQLLLETEGIDVDAYSNTSAISLAAQFGNESAVRCLHEVGHANVESKNFHRSGQTPLCMASVAGHVKVVRYLLSTNKVNANSRNDYGRSPLSYASIGGHEDVVRCLVESGQVDVNSQDKRGRTALSYASENGHKGIARCLLETGQVDINLRDDLGRNAFLYASLSGHREIVQCLLETGQVRVVNDRDDLGRSPLSYASEFGHEDTVRYLLETGQVDIYLGDKTGRTPLHYAVKSYSEKVARCLIETGKVDPNVTDNLNETPLSYAVRRSNLKLIEYLLDTGRVDASLEMRDIEDKTPLDYSAQSHQSYDIQKLLWSKMKFLSVSEKDELESIIR